MQIAIAHGDGVGPETMEVVLDAFRAAGVPLRFEPVRLGQEAVRAGAPTGMDDAAREAVERSGVLLKGPTEVTLGAGRADASIRRAWGAFAQKRVYRMLPGVPAPLGMRSLDLTLIDELGDSAFGPSERLVGEGVAQHSRFATRANALRVHRYAFEVAARKAARRITCAHQADVMRLVDGMFLDAFYEVAQEYPDLRADDLSIGQMAMQLVTNPESFDVIVQPDKPGTILADLAAGLVGGLAYAPMASIGEEVCVFEPMHGVEHALAGRDAANPTALLLAGTMMLRHIGLGGHAFGIERALARTLHQIHCRPELRAYTQEFRTSIFRYRLIEELLAERSAASQPAHDAANRRLASHTAKDSIFADQLEGLA